MGEGVRVGVVQNSSRRPCMTPLSFEWQWNIDYVLFMGFLYLALGIVGVGLIVAYVKTWTHMREEDTSETRRHGEIASRTKYSEY
jgi:hypothetical protein